MSSAARLDENKKAVETIITNTNDRLDDGGKSTVVT